MKIQSVVVYCASSADIKPAYFQMATRLGKLLCENSIACITGAGNQGLMGAINDSVVENGGRSIGIIPQFMVDSGWCHTRLSDLFVTENIHIRKAKMAEMSDAAVALPGGLGTLEELAEILTWKQLGLYKKKVIILNMEGYYDWLLSFFEKIIEEKFMKPEYGRLWEVAHSPEEVIKILDSEDTFSEIPSKY